MLEQVAARGSGGIEKSLGLSTYRVAALSRICICIQKSRSYHKSITEVSETIKPRARKMTAYETARTYVMQLE